MNTVSLIDCIYLQDAKERKTRDRTKQIQFKKGAGRVEQALSSSSYEFHCFGRTVIV